MHFQKSRLSVSSLQGYGRPKGSCHTWFYEICISFAHLGFTQLRRDMFPNRFRILELTGVHNAVEQVLNLFRLPFPVTWWAQTWKVLWDPFPAPVCIFWPSRNNDESESHVLESLYPLPCSRHQSRMIDPVGLVKIPHFVKRFFDCSPVWILSNTTSTKA